MVIKLSNIEPPDAREREMADVWEKALDEYLRAKFRRGSTLIIDVQVNLPPVVIETLLERYGHLRASFVVDHVRGRARPCLVFVWQNANPNVDETRNRRLSTTELCESVGAELQRRGLLKHEPNQGFLSVITSGDHYYSRRPPLGSESQDDDSRLKDMVTKVIQSDKGRSMIVEVVARARRANYL